MITNLSKTELKRYNAALKLFEYLQQEANRTGAIIFHDGTPAHNQLRFFRVEDNGDVVVPLDENAATVYIDTEYSSGLDMTPSEFKKFFKETFKLYDEIYY